MRNCTGDLCSVICFGTVYVYLFLHLTNVKVSEKSRVEHNVYLKKSILSFCFLRGLCCNLRFENLLSGIYDRWTLKSVLSSGAASQT
jgi:hypothetical protein